MPFIYSQATVTIIASRPNGVDEGFLHKRLKMAEDTPSKVFELPFKCADNQLGSVVLLPRVSEAREPLNSRAWALQERFPSPRILEYGSIQTRWICQETGKVPSGIPNDGYKTSLIHHEDTPSITPCG